MRIAVIGCRHILSSYSGIERALSAFLPYMAARGHEVTVFGGPPPANAPEDAALWHGVRNVPVRALAGKHAETLVRASLATAMAVKQGFDVLHFTHQGPGLFAPVGMVGGTPTIVTVPGLDWQRAKWGPLARNAIRLSEKVAVRSADGIVVLSRRIQRYFQDSYGRETAYIPNGITLSPPPESTEYLQRIGVRPGNYLVFAARLVPEKACHELIEAWNDVESDMPLVVAGGNRTDDAYVRRLHAMAKRGRVVFTGHVEGEALHQLFGHAHLFVLPSHLEGQSVALLEALGHGRAALVSDIPENIEVIEENGFRFRVGDVADLREKLATLVADRPAVRAMEAQVRNAVGALPDWQRVAELHLQLYADCLRRRAQPRGLHAAP